MKRFFRRFLAFFISPAFLKTGLAFICGMITVGALPPYYYLFCLMIGFSALMFLLNRAETKKQAFFLGYAFGFGFFGLGLSWVSNALLTEGMGFAWLAPLPPVGFGLWGGFFPAFVCLTAFCAKKGLPRLFAFTGAWGIFEWVRAWLFTGFPWNLIATVWTDTPQMLQTASLWGSYGLSMITVFAAVLPCFVLTSSDAAANSFWKKYRFNFLSLLLLCAFSGFVFYYGKHRLSSAPSETDVIRGISLRLVQANVPQGQKWNRTKAEEVLMNHVHLSRSAGAEKVTHVIWPETATQFLLAQDEFARAMAVNALKPGALLLTGSLRSEPSLNPAAVPPFNVYNSILVFDDGGNLVGSYDKAHLVPFGEYAPLRSIFPFMQKFTPGAFDFSAGDGVKTVNIRRNLPIGMLVCYEAIFPGETVDPKSRPYWLLNVTNDGWYGISAGPYQHFAAAQMRAIEEGIPLVRAANTGISGVIDAYGRVTASLPLGIRGFVDAGLPRRTDIPTLYAAYGNKIPLGLAVLCLAAAFFPSFKKKLKGNSK